MSRPIILGIVGDSAAGKTTLTKGIAQVIAIDESEHRHLMVERFAEWADNIEYCLHKEGEGGRGKGKNAFY